MSKNEVIISSIIVRRHSLNMKGMPWPFQEYLPGAWKKARLGNFRDAVFRQGAQSHV